LKSRATVAGAALKNARSMLSPKDRSNAFSYLACCRLFGINPEEIRERVLERYRQRHTH